MNNNKENIITSFLEVITLKSLCDVMNRAKDLLYGSKSRKPIRLKAVTYYANHYIKKSKYKTFRIKKRSGGERVIMAPHKGLKTMQRALALLLTEMFEYSRISYGFIPNRSIVDNAQVHINRNYVFNIDIKDFFPSCEFGRIKAVMMLPPFNCTIDIAYAIASICCADMKVNRVVDGVNAQVVRSVLPQGAPTSPVLTNVICQRLDRKLIGLANRFGVKVSRYADDISFSSDFNVYQEGSEFRIELQRIIESQGFKINDKKVRLQSSKERQSVTGLVVNENVTLHRNYVKSLRTMLHNWDKSGYDYASDILAKNYFKSSNDKSKIPNLENLVEGKLLYMKMVMGETHSTYRKLNIKFLSLADRKPLETGKGISTNTMSATSEVSLDLILDAIVNEGLNKGMILYEQYQKKRG